MFTFRNARHEKKDDRHNQVYYGKIDLIFITDALQALLDLSESNPDKVLPLGTEWRKRVAQKVKEELGDRCGISMSIDYERGEWNDRWQEPGKVLFQFTYLKMYERPSLIPSEVELNQEAMGHWERWVERVARESFHEALQQMREEAEREETIEEASWVAKQCANHGKAEAIDRIDYSARLAALKQELREETEKVVEEMISETRRDEPGRFREESLRAAEKHWDKFYSTGPLGGTKSRLSEDEVFENGNGGQNGDSREAPPSQA